MLDFVFFPLLSKPYSYCTVYCHKISLTQRNANTELKELVQSVSCQAEILFSWSEMKAELFVESIWAFILRARPTHCPTAEIFSSQEHFQKLDFMHESASKGTSKVFHSTTLSSHLDAIVTQRFDNVLILWLEGKVQFIDNPYFPCQVN